MSPTSFRDSLQSAEKVSSIDVNSGPFYFAHVMIIPPNRVPTPPLGAAAAPKTVKCSKSQPQKNEALSTICFFREHGQHFIN